MTAYSGNLSLIIFQLEKGHPVEAVLDQLRWLKEKVEELEDDYDTLLVYCVNNDIDVETVLNKEGAA